ncbi:TPA: DUF1367 family protein [Yersinia enterocolitica]|nr:DUF1367 family protein [Yersinia enterocolitica]HDL7831451.1 DUF1367 family protein [Yersinia enterocolitica]HDL7873915.1 DUF1367 family protein [Yersinia enterocolitica]HDL7885824.1 DUF1367 family protein [Yersinia enterocolitica]HDL7894756.1 DUF1367 family protein [Yersinia enterocolitica]
MAQLSFIKSSNETLTPATPDVRDFLHYKVKLGAILTADFKQVRNPKFHRKYFSLLNLGFDYWTPSGGTISPEEKKLVRGYVNYLAEYAGHSDTLEELARQYLDTLAEQRADRVTLLKSFDAFRRWTTIQAGYYAIIQMPDGSQFKEPKSISFASMDDTEFSELYKATLDVLWQFILNKTFSTPAAAENAASQLLSYA